MRRLRGLKWKMVFLLVVRRLLERRERMELFRSDTCTDCGYVITAHVPTAILYYGIVATLLITMNSSSIWNSCCIVDSGIITPTERIYPEPQRAEKEKTQTAIPDTYNPIMRIKDIRSFRQYEQDLSGMIKNQVVPLRMHMYANPK